MKKGRTVSDEEYTMEHGLERKINEEEEEYQRKVIHFKNYSFPEVNPINFISKNGKTQAKLANYRYPSQTGERKGIILFVHGYGDYCGRYAYFAKYFAENGYDLVGIDQRGFGYSEGERGAYSSEDHTL